MLDRRIESKHVIEGPPHRKCSILLRQTSFQAVAEPIYFLDCNEEGGRKFGVSLGWSEGDALGSSEVADAFLGKSRLRSDTRRDSARLSLEESL